MTESLKLPNLHDAVLESIAFDWATGVARLDVIRIPGGPIRLSATGVSGLRLTRRQEWGPSVYINNARLDQSEHAIEFELEMQSGDTVVIAAEGLAVTPR